MSACIRLTSLTVAHDVQVMLTSVIIDGYCWFAEMLLIRVHEPYYI